MDFNPSFPSLKQARLHLISVYAALPLFFTLSWSDISSSRRIIYAVIQICCIHHRLHSQLVRPVCGGDALPCLSCKNITILVKFGIFFIYFSFLIKWNQTKCINHTDVQMSSKMLPFQEKLDYFCFLLFLFFCGGCGLYVRFNIPEIENKTALEIAAEFQKMHCKSEESQREKGTELKLNSGKTYETKFWVCLLQSYSVKQQTFSSKKSVYVMLSRFKLFN